MTDAAVSASPATSRSRLRSATIVAMTPASSKAAAHRDQIVESAAKRLNGSIGTRGIAESGAPCSRARIAGSATRRSASASGSERDPRAAVVGDGPDAAVVGHDDLLHEGKAEPVPRALVVKNGRNIRSATDGEIPGPLSVTVTEAASVRDRPLPPQRSSGPRGCPRRPRARCETGC